MYEVNTLTDRGASTPMLPPTVTTDSNGGFTITLLYTCPASNPFVYIVSTGGNPGLGVSANNADIVLMAALGRCSTLTSTTFITINELTTAVAVLALAPFMTDAADIGSSPTNLSSIGEAFQTATTSINLSTGTFNGSSLNVFQLQITTVANELAACVNTSGGPSGDGTACGNLLLWAGSGSADMATAAQHIVQSPAKNAVQLYGLIVATPPFQPYFTSVPSDLAVTVGFAVPPNIHTGTIDSTGQLWVYTGGLGQLLHGSWSRHERWNGAVLRYRIGDTAGDSGFWAPLLAAPGSPYSGGSLLIASGTLDGAGNFWYLTSGIAATGVVGTSPGTFTGTAKLSTYLNGISPSGTLLTTYNSSTNAFGLQPSGVGLNATVTSTNASVAPLSFSVKLLGVDVFGNIWVEDTLSNRIIKIPGVATANHVNC